MNTVESLNEVLDAIWPELPDLLGEAWEAIEPALSKYRRQLEESPENFPIIQAQILLALSAFPEVYARFLTLVPQETVMRHLLPQPDRGIVSEATASGNITRYVDIACPRRVWVETERFTVVVRLTVDKPTHSATQDVLANLAAAPVQVKLTALAFKILNEAKQETAILADRDSPPLVYDLRPQQIGHTRIDLDFYQNGQPLRTVSVPVQVTVYEVTQDESIHAQEPLSELDTVTPPDMVLHVGWDADKRSLNFTLIRDGGAWWREFAPVQLNGDPSTHARELYRRITSLANRADPTGSALLSQEFRIPAEDIDRRLAKHGQYLWETLLPNDLREFYAAERDNWTGRSILVYSDEPHLPWELIWPYDETNGTWEDEAPWCVTMRLTRWLRRDAQGNGNVAAPGFLTMNASAVIAANYTRLSNLPMAPIEQNTLRSLLGSHNVTDVSPAEAKWSTIMDLLERGDYDWIHVASHGSFYAQSPEGDSAIWLDGENALTPEHLSGAKMARHFREKRPAFVFNACEVGRQGWSLTHIGGWANRLVRMGAGMFVGPLWIVSDTGAAVFANAFYQSLLAGETVGRAAQHARMVARAEGDPTWLAYSVYAHPNARLSVTGVKVPSAKLS